MWFGTDGGLARFDGERFEIFDAVNTPTLQDGRCTALFEDAQGILWIGHESGVITRYQQGRFESVTLHAESAREKIVALGSDENGRVWAMRGYGAIDAVDDKERIPSLMPSELPGYLSWSRNAAGTIWLTENGRLARLRGGKPERIALNGNTPSDDVTCVAASADGGVWPLRYEPRLQKWLNGRWVEDRGAYPWPPGSLSCALELRDGTLAVGTIFSGLYLIFKDGRPPVHFDQSNGLPQNWVRFLYEDRESNLWAGAGSAGLVAIRKSPFSVLTAPDSWEGRTILCVAPGHDNSLWIGTEGAGLYHYSGGRWKHFGEAEGVMNPYIWAAAESPEGAVWIGNYWWGGPYKLVDGKFVRSENMDTRSSPVLTLDASSPAGELLVGMRDGLLRLTGESAKWLYKAPGTSNPDVRTVIRGHEGVIWFGLAQGGLGRVAHEEVTIFNRKEGLSSDAVQCLLSDAESNALWVGTTDGGLIRYKDGCFSNISTSHGLIDNAICQILDDGMGYLWLSTHHGIQRVAKAELNRCADGHTASIASQTYDRNDGLPALDFVGGRQGAGCKTADGRLWFTSSKGVVTVDPSRIQPNPTIPPVVIQSFLVDTKNVGPVREKLSSPLSPAHQRLEFHYAGLSFAAPNKVLFKYKLDGLDKDWIDAGNRRTAYYSHLPAGAYHFRVVACNNDGLWNLEGATLAFTVAPFFWQTWWFITLCATAILSLVAWLVRYLTRRRMVRRLEQLERLHAIERERARIARDIHDDLGGNLTHIAILSQPAPHKIREPAQAANVLSGIYMTAREGIRALDEIVWAVDPQHDTLESLVSYMGKYAQDFLDAANVICRLNFPIELPPWEIGAETRHNLFLAFKESLNNTLKHAGATEVHLTLSLEPHAFVLIIKDNGRGFESVNPAPKHNGRAGGGHGLINLERRLAAIGGRCEIKTSPTEGTQVAFIVTVSPENARPTTTPV